MTEQGAHLHRCGFQVRTPRDANWQRRRANTDEDREEFAGSLVGAPAVEQLPTGKGPADYALTDDGRVRGMVEAKG
jgi:hypothetical protein